MDPTFTNAVVASGSNALSLYMAGMWQIILAIGPYVIGLIVLGIFVRFVVGLLHKPKHIGRNGR